MDNAEILRIATRLRRETRHPDVLALCEAVVRLIAVPSVVVPKRDRAEYMRAYRARKTNDR